MSRRARLLRNAATVGGLAATATSAMTPFALAFTPAPTTTRRDAPHRHPPGTISLDRGMASSVVPFQVGASRYRAHLLLNPAVHDGSVSAFLPSSSLLSSEPIAAFSSILLQNSGNVPFLPSLLLNAVLFFSLRPKLMTMLTPAGFLHSLALGTALWTTLGWRGWTVCVLYLFLGQLVTKVGFEEKESLGIAEGRGGRRGPENVWGSALTGTLCATAAARAMKEGAPFLGLASNVWVLGYVASLATKLADTFASEIGKAYGKTTFLITTLKSVQPGTEGAISLEGTLASIVGGLSLSIYAYLAVGLIPSLEGVGVATFAAFFATMCESLIGATLQEKEGLKWMTNEVVNFFNTLIGAAAAMAMGVLALGM